VLFGEHHSHNYRKEAPASSLNLKEVKEVFELVAGSVKLVLLPDS
jgi:Zn finger protein HypA/HybF involved in hydrogenase expression